VFAGIPSDWSIVGTQSEFGDIVASFDVVIELSQVIDCRPLDVLGERSKPRAGSIFAVTAFSSVRIRYAINRGCRQGRWSDARGP
jgi:hypothetical protein